MIPKTNYTHGGHTSNSVWGFYLRLAVFKSATMLHKCLQLCNPMNNFIAYIQNHYSLKFILSLAKLSGKSGDHIYYKDVLKVVCLINQGEGEYS